MHSLCQTNMLAKVHFPLLIKLARQTEISKCKLLTKWQATPQYAVCYKRRLHEGCRRHIVKFQTFSRATMHALIVQTQNNKTSTGMFLSLGSDILVTRGNNVLLV